MGEPWTYPIKCPRCGSRWYEGNEGHYEVDPMKASDGETLCSPECLAEYEADMDHHANLKPGPVIPTEPQ